MEPPAREDGGNAQSPVRRVGIFQQNDRLGVWLKQEKRAILYMIPCKGYFLASFALGEKAVNAAHESDLPASVLTVIDNSKKYAEGRGVRLEIRKAEDVNSVEKIAAIKMNTRGVRHESDRDPSTA